MISSATVQSTNARHKIASPVMAGRGISKLSAASRGELRSTRNRSLRFRPLATRGNVLAAGSNAVLYIPLRLFLLIDAEFIDIHFQHFQIIVDERLDFLMPHKGIHCIGGFQHILKRLGLGKFE